jgi:sortase A
MQKNEIFKFLVLRSIGNFLLLFAVFGVFATFGPALFYETQYRVAAARGVRFTISEPKPQQPQNQPKLPTPAPSTLNFADLLVGPKEHQLIPFDTKFSILIPKIGANARVFANTDPSDEKEFLPVLQQGVAHAKGSVFPGLPGNTYIFAHSADNFWDVGRYNAVFYLLKDLAAGDDIVIFFEDQRFNYKVSEVKVVDAEDVSLLANSQHKGEPVLILQTCWPPGTTWKRLIVVAKLN